MRALDPVVFGPRTVDAHGMPAAYAVSFRVAIEERGPYTRSPKPRLPMSASRFFRYLAPNLVTALGMLFGLIALAAIHEGRFVSAAWLIIWAVLIDRLDGLVARTLKATSDFGVQMDSLADAFNFGLVPAALVYVSLGSTPELGFDHGGRHVLLSVACVMWFLAAVFRLAKFNVITEQPESKHLFFGVATTLAAGTLATWYIVLHKYSPEGAPLGSGELFRGPYVLGGWQTSPQMWAYLPPAMILGALLMASNLPSPKLGKSRYLWLNVILIVGVGGGFICGFARIMPDLMALLPSVWIVSSLIWGQTSKDMRGLEPPSFLPPPSSQDEDDAEETEDAHQDPLHHGPS